MSTPFIITDNNNHRLIGWWLLIICLLVLAIVMVGGATRLTQSGLSIVEWKPLSGIFPPLTEEAWAAELEAYRQYPEYQLVNKGMSIEAFKSIYWWEFYHRLLGRLIGVAFAVPFLFFMAKKMIPASLKMRLFGILCLGAAQGFMGWYMVASGLVNEPDVSHYRLAAHLGLALLIFAFCLWTAFDLLRPNLDRVEGWGAWPLWIVGLIAVQIFAGALVAGLDAGFAYNTWPDMHGTFLPIEAFHLSPIWHNFTENVAMVQFLHRMLAYGLLALVVAAFIKGRKMHLPERAKRALLGLKIAVSLQLVLGIVTLLMVVPVSLGVLHQGMAVLVLAAGLHFAYEVRGNKVTG